MRKLPLAPLCALALAMRLGAQVKPSPALLVLSKADMTLAIVDPATRAILARVPSGPDPHEVIASTDGRLAFISNYGGGAYNTLTPVDLVHAALAARRGRLEATPGRIWFTAEAAKVVGSYDVRTNKIDLVLGTGQARTHMIAVSADGKHVITSNVNAPSVSFIDQARQPTQAGRGATPAVPPEWDETVVPVGRGAEGFDLSPDGKELWVANAGDGTISIIDTRQRRVKETLQANVASANRLKFTPDGKLVFVSLLRSNEPLVVLDAASHKEIKRLAIGHGAAGILMQPDGALAYVSCTPDDYVVVVNLNTLQESARISAGRQPDGLAWAVAK